MNALQFANPVKVSRRRVVESRRAMRRAALRWRAARRNGDCGLACHALLNAVGWRELALSFERGWAR